MVAQLSWDYIKMRPSKIYSRLISYTLFEGRPLLTKGRWINPIVFTLLSLEKSLPPPKKVYKPIYIVGVGRSGTTILGVVLSMHKDVGFLNEPKALWNKIYPYEDLIGNYTLGKAFYRLDEKIVNEKIIKTAHRLYGWYLTLSLSNRVVDKYPEMIFRIDFIKAIFPDAKFLFLVRNGKDVCFSIKRWSQKFKKFEKGTHQSWWGLNDRKWNLLVEQIVKYDDDLKDHVNEIKEFKDDINRAAVEWIVSMKEGLKFMKKYSEDILIVKYEELVDNVEGTLKNICDFCELKYDEKFFQFGKKILKPKERKYPEKVELSPIIEHAFKKVLSQCGFSI